MKIDSHKKYLEIKKLLNVTEKISLRQKRAEKKEALRYCKKGKKQVNREKKMNNSVT